MTIGQCGMNSGFCKLFPAKYLIDYVRVYQNKNDSLQTIGACDAYFVIVHIKSTVPF